MPGLQHSQTIASHFHGFSSRRFTRCLLSGRRGHAVESPWAACKFFRIPKISFFDSVTALVKILLQIATVLDTQIHVQGLLGILRECTRGSTGEKAGRVTIGRLLILQNFLLIMNGNDVNYMGVYYVDKVL